MAFGCVLNPVYISQVRSLLANCLRVDRVRLEAEFEACLADGGVEEARLAAVRRLVGQARRSIETRHRRHERLPQVSYPSHLPITTRKDDIVAAVKRNQVVVIAGETGSGKTTQIPKMCLEAGLGVEGKIGCTQPRRVAALSISRRIAQELQVTWGEEVGCKIRFSDRSSPLTYIKLMTDGILLAETQGDRDLGEYDAIVIDEAHERSLNIDFLLGHLKLLLQRRPDLKLIITSATIDTEAFSQAFGDAPVIEVSGRTYPVEIRYAPHDAEAEESGDMTYIDAAVNATEDVLLESDRGDVLIFMPTERDIRETQDDLDGRFSSEAEVIPLFGRLTSGEQDRVFAPSARRKIIVATNIAETSLTIPGVRYVIDTGLARMSRYSPRTRTKRLPIEPISQSSAKQRAGRSGRVENGVCIRLYSEEDLAARPRDTQPEIQRANLAEVILKMKAWRLGEMETFPFINPPQPAAVQSGYQLLQELGAIDEDRNLTTLGRDLARLPVDPSIGRMILQALREQALADVLVVAAGLSIQDPRDRPLEQEQAADLAHRQFLDPHSDFLTLLNIWRAFHDRIEALRTQNQIRKFCRASFLSYTRMREWVDVHAQLEEAIENLRNGAGERPAPPGAPEAPRGPGRRRHDGHAQIRSTPEEEARYAAVHRSVLAGLLGHIVQRTERNLYRASGNRQLMLWPGSALFERTARKEGRGAARPAETKVNQPAWLVVGEVVETSRLYGRTAAGVKPEWIADLGAHLCKRTYGEPSWDGRVGRVLSRERTTLFGLEIMDRAIDYGRVNPRQATEIFIRAALVEEDVELPHRFLEHNRKLRRKVEVWRTQLRDHHLPRIEEALFDFYARRLSGVSSLHDLNRVLREQGKGDPNFLCATETDLTGGQPVTWDSAAFPTAIRVANHEAPLEYAYAPGEEHDGFTVKLPAALMHRLDAAMLDWIVPGLRAEQVEALLKALPKALRVPLMPIPARAAELAAALEPETGLDGLRRLIEEKYGVRVPADAWKRDMLPAHLRPRIAVTGANQAVVAAGRDLLELKKGVERHETPAEQQAWSRAVQQWERYELRHWDFGDLPEEITVTGVAGAALSAFPGLEVEGAAVHLKLFRKRAEAEGATRTGFARMVELGLQKELAWAQKDLRALEKSKDLYAGLISTEELIETAQEHLKRRLVQVPEPALPLRAAQYQRAVQQARERLPGFPAQLVDLVMTILRLRRQIMNHRGFGQVGGPAPAGPMRDLRQLGTPARPSGIKPLGFLQVELDALVPPRFLTAVSFERLQHWPRYLKALAIRADRALLNPAKDLEKARHVQPYTDALRKWIEQPPASPEARNALAECWALIPEFKVSMFAQELGTAQPVSAKRLDALLERIRAAG